MGSNSVAIELEKTTFKEGMFDKQKLPVRGIAVKSGISRNGILYTKEELKKFAETMKGVSIIKDHEALTDNAVGVVEDAQFLPNSEEVRYEGWIKDEKLNEQVQDGRVKHVSIGAIAGRLVKENEDDDYMIAKDMHCVELSTVIVPGVVGASIQQALVQHEKAQDLKDKLKIPAVCEDVKKFIKLEEWTGNKIMEQKQMHKMETSADTKDGHTHMAMFDDSGNGYTGMSSMMGTSNYQHAHEISNFTVQTYQKGEYVSEHPGKLEPLMNKADGEKLQNNGPKETAVKETITVQNKTEEMLEEKNTMADEKINEMLATLEAREMAFKKQEEMLKVMEAQFLKISQDKKQELVEKYRKVASEKGLEVKEVSGLSEETLKFLVEQLESIKVSKEIKVEEVKQKTRGEVGEGPSKVEESDESFVISKADFGKGYALFRESYNAEKYKRLGR